MKKNLLFLLLLFMYGCCTNYSPEEYLNSWHQPPVNTGPGEKWNRYKGKILLVKKDQLALAENLLEKVPLVEISSDEASGLVGERYQPEGPKKLYLLRGLYIYKTGKFEIKLSNNALWVRHDSHGPCRIPDSRQALVIELEGKPDLVFVTCSGYR